MNKIISIKQAIEKSDNPVIKQVLENRKIQFPESMKCQMCGMYSTRLEYHKCETIINQVI